ncbi:MAG: hypothetical protein AVDCRST_MAG03-2480 [uncultured Rubrobacteraceae bacterium]|uniref:Uncharacterized protein n=1 Tax=uncultured Rubrobacteraceae bacterium TaxID=349277 RepID=A0A6J4PN46_9ACTN|nr:MAG: hypothetical protein AVDCRST_MAG03-2480 [uncultured Rubrobacteraceae bacterium]
MDGSLRTNLNADLAAGHDRVVAVSCLPLTLPEDVDDPKFAAWVASQRAELDAVREGGEAVAVIEPGGSSSLSAAKTPATRTPEGPARRTRPGFARRGSSSTVSATSRTPSGPVGPIECPARQAPWTSSDSRKGGGRASNA